MHPRPRMPYDPRIFLAVLLVLFTGCEQRTQSKQSTEVSSPDTARPLRLTTDLTGVELRVTTDRNVYTIGEIPEVTVSVLNTNDESILLVTDSDLIRWGPRLHVERIGVHSEEHDASTAAAYIDGSSYRNIDISLLRPKEAKPFTTFDTPLTFMFQSAGEHSITAYCSLGLLEDLRRELLFRELSFKPHQISVYTKGKRRFSDNLHSRWNKAARAAPKSAEPIVKLTIPFPTEFLQHIHPELTYEVFRSTGLYPVQTLKSDSVTVRFTDPLPLPEVSTEESTEEYLESLLDLLMTVEAWPGTYAIDRWEQVAADATPVFPRLFAKTDPGWKRLALCYVAHESHISRAEVEAFLADKSKDAIGFAEPITYEANDRVLDAALYPKFVELFD